MDKNQAEMIAKKIGDGMVYSDEYEAFWQYINDGSVSVDERLEVLRPLVFREWEDGVSRAQGTYEELLLELPDYDARIDEFYAEFEVGPDGMCGCERRSYEGVRG